MNLEGKTVLVTGAAKRVGASIARAFAREKANVLVHYHRSLTEAGQLVCELRKLGVDAKAYRADLRKTDHIERLCEKIWRDVGGLDVVVHSASIFYPVEFERVSTDDWDAFLEIHVKAPFLLAQKLAPLMKKSMKKPARASGTPETPAFIFVGDRMPARTGGRFIPYEVSKSALVSLSAKLAVHLAPSIRVNCVHPGLILAPDRISAAARKRLARENLLKTWGNQEDVARAIVFLAKQPFVTGVDLNIDGGHSLVSRV